MLTPTVPPPTQQLTALLTTFGLTTAAEEIVPRLTQAGHHQVVPLLVEVFDAEADARRQRRIARLRRAARLPPGKTFETLDAGRLPLPIMQRLQELATGTFLETATNVLAFGLPGVGKSHALCAVGHAVRVSSIEANRAASGRRESFPPQAIGVIRRTSGETPSRHQRDSSLGRSPPRVPA